MVLQRVPSQCFNHWRDVAKTGITVIDKSGRTALDHLYLVDVTLCVGVPCTTGVLQFNWGVRSVR